MNRAINENESGLPDTAGDHFVIEIVDKPISPEEIVRKVKTDDSGCVATYVGLIRDNSHGKAVRSVEYRDPAKTARDRLLKIAREVKAKWPVNNVAIVHRIGVLKVGEINLVAAVAAGHRQEGFAACAYIVDRFKSDLPTEKIETYL